jgi:hypothetical protein
MENFSESFFMKRNIRILLSRYDFSFLREDRCMEYFIMDKKKMKDVSNALIMSLDLFKKNIHVAKFYPELYKQLNSKYMSAACFYLLVHHFGQYFHLDGTYHIDLETTPNVFHEFYEKLKDFHLHITTFGLGHTVYVLSDYTPVQINTDLIHERVLETNEDMYFM